MTKFQHWLDSTPGMASQLAKELGVGPGTISNVKKRRRRMPPYWMPIVNKLSSGKLSLETLLLENGSKPRRT